MLQWKNVLQHLDRFRCLSDFAYRLDDGEVAPEASMSAGAFYAQQDAVCGSAPAGLGLSTVHAGTGFGGWGIGVFIPREGY